MMKLQNFSVIFIVIILPIVLVLSVYTKNLISVENQKSLNDSTLLNSTYDAVRAYQMNTLQNNFDAEINSKVRDINASVNTFFNSLSLGFSSSGLSKHELTDHIPAILFTLYDGFYVYGAYSNIAKAGSGGNVDYSTSTSGNRRQYGLKPYIYYSCEYSDGNYDFIVNYTLDNYITVTGTYRDGSGSQQYVSESGYYVNYNNIYTDEGSKTVTLNGGDGGSVVISPESLEEELIALDTYETLDGRNYKFNYRLVPESGTAKRYKYITYNGVKYYLDEENMGTEKQMSEERR